MLEGVGGGEGVRVLLGPGAQLGVQGQGRDAMASSVLVVGGQGLRLELAELHLALLGRVQGDVRQPGERLGLTLVEF